MPVFAAALPLNRYRLRVLHQLCGDSVPGFCPRFILSVFKIMAGLKRSSPHCCRIAGRDHRILEMLAVACARAASWRGRPSCSMKALIFTACCYARIPAIGITAQAETGLAAALLACSPAHRLYRASLSAAFSLCHLTSVVENKVFSQKKRRAFTPRTACGPAMAPWLVWRHYSCHRKLTCCAKQPRGWMKAFGSSP